MSGIYIKGMEMPTGGKVRQVVIASDGKCYKTVYQAAMEVGSFADAIPVPDHGDLIDKQYAYQNTMMMAERTRKMVLNQINALPTVIPADFAKDINVPNKEES